MAIGKAMARGSSVMALKNAWSLTFVRPRTRMLSSQ
jgi:hypothetical protein